MAKHTGVTIRMGAAYDDVTVRMSNGTTMYFDRADMTKRKHEGEYEDRKVAKEELYRLRKGVVDAFVMQQELKNARKAKRHNRRQRRVQKEQSIAA